MNNAVKTLDVAIAELGVANQKIKEIISEKDKAIENLQFGGHKFADFLKGKGILDETITILNHHGIDNLKVLRDCSQEVLVAAGIKIP